jgi:protein phosphatase 4 regulatory subunit 3
LVQLRCISTNLHLDDPDFPAHKANHRKYLANSSRFKEVVRIQDVSVRQKIHYTYRLQYLKDVVLARILDDPTFSVLNSLIFFNQVEIVQHVQANPQFLKELFSIFTTPDHDPRRKRDAVLFIQQCCSIAKSIQLNVRAGLFNHFIGGGLFVVITYALKHPESNIRVAGTEILIALIDHDALLMRSQIFKALQEKQKPLTDTLIELLLDESDLGVKAQMAEAIKVLLDPIANAQSIASIDSLNRREVFPRIQNPGTDQFIQHFYDESAKKLFKPLKDLENRKSSMYQSQNFLGHTNKIISEKPYSC